MSLHESDALSRRWLWLSAIGLILFLLVQVLPTSAQLFQTGDEAVMTRSKAERTAFSVASDRFGVRDADVNEVTVTHLSDSDAVGYYAKNDLLKAYNDRLDATLPTDYYRVDLHLNGGEGTLRLLLHLQTGKLVGWKHQLGVGAHRSANDENGADGEPLSQAEEAARADLALRYAAAWGVRAEDWEWTGLTEADGSALFDSKQAGIGEAKPWLRVRAPSEFRLTSSAAPPWEGGYVLYGTDLPADFIGYMNDQEHWASQLSKFGYILPQLFMLVCAIVATGTYAGHSSYRRGIFLALTFFVLYVALTYNMIPGLRASQMGISADSGDALGPGTVTVSLMIYGIMAALTYFAAVGGDGVWKAMGRALWPRWKEAGYGEAVLRSMKTGYFLAFILLGAQSVVLLALERSLDSFSSSDPSQSMYNMTYPWLLPLLAWCAGISEELQSRLFGIGLFRRWFVGLARRILGREPKPGAAAWLTWAAMLPPGLMWALGHVGYAVYPFYTRLIELVLLSMLFGWFMLRFGLMAVIFAHVALDAILMGVQMMTDGLPGDYWGGLFSLLMPGLVGIVIWRLHRALRPHASA